MTVGDGSLSVRESAGEVGVAHGALVDAGLATRTGRRERKIAVLADFFRAQAVGKERGQRVRAFQAELGGDFGILILDF